MNYDYQAIKEELMAGRYPVIDRATAKALVKGIKHISLHAHIAAGNMKLPADTAIFNMGPAATCPSEALGLCQAINAEGKNICYAKKAERIYPSVLPYRMRQAEYWKATAAEEFALQFLLINALSKTPYTAMRMNESGDFYGQEDLLKADTIARILKHYGVSTYIYTARRDLDFSMVEYLVVNGSGFMVPGITNEFRYIESRAHRPRTHALCPGDCRICTRCQQYHKLTAVIKH